MFRSGAMKKYASRHEADSKRATELFQQVAMREEGTSYGAKSLKELEQELVEIHRLRSEIDHLISRYRESMQEDKDKRHRLPR